MYVLVSVLNVMLYYFFAFINVFVVFLFFGEGVASEKYSIWTSLFFVLMQIALLFLLFKKSLFMLVLNVFIAISLFLFFNFYI